LTQLFGAYYAGATKAPAYTIGMDAGGATFAGTRPLNAGQRRAAEELAETTRIAYGRLSEEGRQALNDVAGARAVYEQELAREENQRYDSRRSETRAQRTERSRRRDAAWHARRAVTSLTRRLLMRTPVVGEIVWFYVTVKRAIQTRGRSLPVAMAYASLRDVPGFREAMLIYGAAKFVYEMGQAVNKLTRALVARQAAAEARRAAESVRPAPTPPRPGEGFRAPGATVTTPIEMPLRTAAGVEAVDSLGRSLAPAAVRAAVEADTAVSTARDALAIRLRAVYADAGEAGERLATLVERYGHAEAAERIKRAPEVLGTLRGNPGSAARADATGRLEAVTGNVTQLGGARELAERTYREDVTQQLRYDADPIRSLSVPAREAIERIAQAEGTAERAAAYRSLRQHPSIGEEVQAFMERSTRRMQGHRPPTESPREAARRVGKAMMKGATEGAAVAEETVRLAMSLVPGARVPMEAVRIAAAMSRLVRVVSVGERAVRAANRLTRGLSQDRGGGHSL
jgi:hypothetical protein